MNLYPRPQFLRENWLSLNGLWDFAESQAKCPEDVDWNQQISVPYAPESKLSGIHKHKFYDVVWYRKTFKLATPLKKKYLLLHFGAVDYQCQVFVNNRYVMTHEGGHISFSVDISEQLNLEEEQTICVRVTDDPKTLDKPRGKQDWQVEPHVIWYPRTTGIWQSVWLEPLNELYIKELRFTANLERFSIETELKLNSFQAELSLELTFSLRGQVLASDTYDLKEQRTSREIRFKDPGIDDARAAYLWSPETPNLIDVELILKQDTKVLDKVQSYTALRTVGKTKKQFVLNGRPYFLRLVLDQGYWAESLMTAPNDDSLKQDIELTKQMGFNGVRKHQKIEDPRYLYWADKLGLLVWEELPSAYCYTTDTVTRLTKEWLEVIKRDYNHPCIVTWVVFNESWGVPDLPQSAAQRHAVRALYHLSKSLDSSRLVVGNDGWEHVITDLLTLHDYQRDPNILAKRYGSAEAAEQTSFFEHLDHGRATVLETSGVVDKPILLSEFGGIRFDPEAKENGWGYQEVNSPEKLLEIYAAMIKAISTGGLAGFCYTQLTDTFQEQNGLLYMNREPKVPLQALFNATQGRG